MGRVAPRLLAPSLIALGCASLVRAAAADAPVPAPAGHDDHFFLASQDGRHRLQFAGQLQLRYIFNEDGAGQKRAAGGFEMRRFKVEVGGHVWTPRLRFLIQGEFDRAEGGLDLDEAYIAYDLDEHHHVSVGAVQAPFLHEDIVSNKRQLAVDRSNVNAMFRLDKVDGLMLGGDYSGLRWRAVLHDGRQSRTTRFDRDDTDWAALARVEARLLGAWSQFRDFVAWRGEEPALMLGVAGDFEEGAPDVGVQRFWQAQADATCELYLVSLFATVVSRRVTLPDDSAFQQWGVLAQSGVTALPDRLQLFARWERLEHDGYPQIGRMLQPLQPPLADRVDIFTGGFNVFVHEHDVKLSFDLLYAADGISQADAGSATVAGRDPQLVARGLLQLVF